MQERRSRETGPDSNHTLAARICAELDHAVEHAKGIQVFADDSNITLRGDALRDELDEVLNAIRRVRGVRRVTNHLEVSDSPGKVLALQS
ncbi:MAG: BON domain-containing protein [Gemmatimonadales bacterium]